MTKKIKIRRATGWDVVEVTRLLVRGALEQRKEIWYPKPSQNAARKVGHVLALIDQGLVIVAEQEVDARIVGAVGMAVCQDTWSDQWKLVNEWIYILPDFRDVGLDSQLLTAVEMFADDQVDPDTQEGLPVIMAMISGQDTELKDELMKRRGYQYGGGNFVREPTGVQKNVQVQKDDQHNGDPKVAGVG